MSYQVLARKWRPQNFEQLVGQEHVLGALVNALENDRLHHAYLFSGTRGVGKTTIARILARSLNCETGITAKPCGECASCQEITEGRFVDLIEVDAASRTKVEDTRDLLENVQYRPTRGRFKIYLIDEVHMLSNHSFNALLKTLEEPPEHVKFLLATTDPQKLPVTVLSRCLQFNLKNLPAQRISEYLEQVLNEEKVPFEKNALVHLARSAAGSMRDALSLTDQAISHGGGKLSEQDVVDMLGTVDRKRIREIVQAISTKDGDGLLNVCQDLAQYSVDYLTLLEEMLALFHAVAVCQVVPDSESTQFGDREWISELAQSMSQEDVQLSYQILLMGRKDLTASPDLHIGFEMLMLRLLAFQPESKSSGVVQEVQASEVNTAKKPEAAAQNEPQSAVERQDVEKANDEKVDVEILERAFDESAAASALATNINAKSDPTTFGSDSPPWLESEEPPPWDDDGNDSSRVDTALQSETKLESVSESEVVLEPSISSTPSNPPVPEVEQEPGLHLASSESADEDDAPKELKSLKPANWISLYKQLPISGMVKSVSGHMVLKENRGGSVCFHLTEAGQPLYKSDHAQRLADVLTKRFNEPVEVSVEMSFEKGENNQETPAENAKRVHREAITAAEKSILSDPLVEELMAEFQAELVPDSVNFHDSKQAAEKIR